MGYFYIEEVRNTMKVTIQQTEKLLKEHQSFSQLGFSLMITRLKTRYGTDPSQSTLQSCMGEINEFLDKFAGIMDADYAVIAKM